MCADHVSIPHSCDFCSSLLLSFYEPQEPVYTFESWAALQKVREGCSLMRSVLQQLDNGSSVDTLTMWDWVKEKIYSFCMPTTPRGPVDIKVHWEKDEMELDYTDETNFVFNARTPEECHRQNFNVLKFEVASKERNHHQKFLVSTNQGDLASRWVRSRPSNLEPGSLNSMNEAKRWFLECESRGGEYCNPEPVSRPPKRIIDLGRANDDIVPFLREDTSSFEFRYAALSYCWGADPIVLQSRTTTANVVERSKGIPLQDLSKSILDAFTVTRALGIRYLWVDALCIVQDDEEEVEEETAQMKAIYKGSTITISAARAAGAEQGFLGPRRDLYSKVGSEQYNLRVLSPDPKNHYCLPPRLDDLSRQLATITLMPFDDSAEDKPSEPIGQRAWTLQEYVLPRRVLEFGTHQTRWICSCAQRVDGGRRTQATEADKSYFLTSLNAFEEGNQARWQPKSSESPWLHWYEIVEQYSGRRLSEPDDKLPALSAIAHEYSEYLPSDERQYLAGIWRRDIHRHLLWKCDFDSAGQSSNRPAKKRAPSWSWAAVNSCVKWLPWYIGKREVQLEILDASATPLNPMAPFGRVKTGEEGWISCRGYIIRVEIAVHDINSVVLSNTTSPVNSRYRVCWDNGVGSANLKELYLLVVEYSESGISEGLVISRLGQVDEFSREGVWQLDMKENSIITKHWCEIARKTTLRLV